ncbi:LysE family transporter [Mycolicibacterium sp. P9-22]|uniref:LysE family transporter n=1 Tax=Mycolicibacterium sp. P9-22 TaxID=2024613 RepID=UPI0011EBABE3|nr:LysE family transporter [Mycolicibacterium sp. P9-22]KAA0115700.1 threonine transporter RhtB [Mycolicibacterium sp. P9-22]
MTWQVWLAFLGAAIVISVAPGPGAVQSMATGMTEGLRRGWWSVFGLEIGLMLQLALVAAGVGAIVAASALAFTVVKWLGVAYLAYLAIRQWRTAPRDMREQLGTSTGSSRRALVARGFLVNATNPKGLVFFLAALPQFVVPAAPLLPQYLAIGLTMIVVDIVVMGFYTGLAGRLMNWLHNARQQTIMNRVIAAMFAGAAVVLSLVRRGAPA